MRVDNTARRVSRLFLCVFPFLAAVAAGVRALRVPGVYQAVGCALFAAAAVAAWLLGARVIGSGAEGARRLALAGGLLVAPWALISLLWVGLATPWDATPAENRMRYLVLLAGSVAVTAAFILLKEALGDAGERLYSTLGFAAALPGGGAYLTWFSFQVGVSATKVRSGQVSPAILAMNDLFDVLLFAACVLTYLATAAFAASLGQARWLGRGAARAYVIASLVALLLIVTRGLSFPDPTAGSAPWYMSLGFIAGIPAVPWVMPFLLGVVLLRRAGDDATGL
jgi:hypothetical protein